MATLSVQGGSVLEQSFGDLIFNVTLSEPVSEVVTVTYRTLPGTALDDVDYGFTEGTLTFNPGEQQKGVLVYARSDSLAELDESVVLELYDPTNADFRLGAATLRGVGWVLEDDDNLSNTRALYVSEPIVRETNANARFAEFTVSVSQPFATDVELDYATIAGSALAGADFAADAGTVRLFAGQSEQVVRIAVRGDTRVEGTEHFFLEVSGVGEVASGAIGAVGRATILDNDSGGAGPVVSVEGGQQTEDSFADIPFVVTLSAPSSETVTVKYRTLPGTATESIDYNRSPSFGVEGTLTFLPGETSKRLTTYGRSDTTVEVDESVVLEVFDPVNASLGGGRQSIRETAWLLEDGDNLGNKRALFVSNPVVEERALSDASFARFEVSLSRPSADRISMRYETANGAATAGDDYERASGRVVFEPGQTRAYVDVEILADRRVEANESFLLRLVPPVPSQIASGAAGILGTATIVDATILGGSGDDTLFGTSSDDVMVGRQGDDRIYGFGGRDALSGESGNDAFYGGAGADRMAGGSGNDRYEVDDPGDRVVEARDEGRDLVRSSIDFKLGGHVENLTLAGRRGVDGTGNGLDNVLRGNARSNELDGGKGDDKLFGGKGGDTLLGGRGEDVLSGGAGDDVFVFISARDSGRGGRADEIRDFDRKRDTVDLSGIDANTGRRGDQDFDFIGRSKFGDEAGELRFARGVLEADLDGDGRSDFEIRLADVARLTTGDLVL